jgi:hypothetical protein
LQPSRPSRPRRIRQPLQTPGWRRARPPKPRPSNRRCRRCAPRIRANSASVRARDGVHARCVAHGVELLLRGRLRGRVGRAHRCPRTRLSAPQWRHVSTANGVATMRNMVERTKLSYLCCRHCEKRRYPVTQSSRSTKSLISRYNTESQWKFSTSSRSTTDRLAGRSASRIHGICAAR